MQTVPKAGVFGFNWFNVWYTPGVSKISTTIRDNNDESFEPLIGKPSSGGKRLFLESWETEIVLLRGVWELWKGKLSS